MFANIIRSRINRISSYPLRRTFFTSIKLRQDQKENISENVSQEQTEQQTIETASPETTQERNVIEPTEPIESEYLVQFGNKYQYTRSPDDEYAAIPLQTHKYEFMQRIRKEEQKMEKEEEERLQREHDEYELKKEESYLVNPIEENKDTVTVKLSRKYLNEVDFFNIFHKKIVNAEPLDVREFLNEEFESGTDLYNFLIESYRLLEMEETNEREYPWDFGPEVIKYYREVNEHADIHNYPLSFHGVDEHTSNPTIAGKKFNPPEREMSYSQALTYYLQIKKQGFMDEDKYIKIGNMLWVFVEILTSRQDAMESVVEYFKEKYPPETWETMRELDLDTDEVTRSIAEKTKAEMKYNDEYALDNDTVEKVIINIINLAHRDRVQIMDVEALEGALKISKTSRHSNVEVTRKVAEILEKAKQIHWENSNPYVIDRNIYHREYNVSITTKHLAKGKRLQRMKRAREMPLHKSIIQHMFE